MKSLKLLLFTTTHRGLCETANFTVSYGEEEKEIKMDFDLVVRNYDSAPINPNDTRCGANCGRSNLRQMLKQTVTNKVRVPHLKFKPLLVFLSSITSPHLTNRLSCPRDSFGFLKRPLTLRGGELKRQTWTIDRKR